MELSCFIYMDTSNNNNIIHNGRLMKEFIYFITVLITSTIGLVLVLSEMDDPFNLMYFIMIKLIGFALLGLSIYVGRTRMK